MTGAGRKRQRGAGGDGRRRSDRGGGEQRTFGVENIDRISAGCVTALLTAFDVAALSRGDRALAAQEWRRRGRQRGGQLRGETLEYEFKPCCDFLSSMLCKLQFTRKQKTPVHTDTECILH